MNSRRVVIVDYTYDYPNKDDRNIEEIKKHKDQIWDHRIAELEHNYTQKLEGASSFDGLFYSSIEQQFKLDAIPNEISKFLLSSERITLSLFQDLIDRSSQGAKTDILLSVGTAQTDILSKCALMSQEGPDLANAIDLIDPLGYIKLLNLNNSMAVESITEASTSGMGALYNAYLKIKKGEFDVAIAGGASGVTFPIPYELSHFGIGSERSIQPFEAEAAGHYFSEGGAAFLLKERQQALADGDSILAEIRDISSGTMGNVVVNRNAVKKLIFKSFQNANISEDSNIFLELYGRGNEIDDTAEISCLKNVKKKYPNTKGGFLKEDVHYIVGYYGMIGFCRLLDSKRSHTPLQGSVIHQPNKFIGAIDNDLWATNVNDYDIISILSYSMHGNCYNMLLDLDHEQVLDEVGDGR